jgi:DNA-binding transcriptional ArsR family regulator
MRTFIADLRYHRCMAMTGVRVQGAAVLLFHSLADPARLAIVKLLSEDDRRVVDLTAELGLAQSTVSGHLACLRSAGVGDARPHGRSTYYRITTSQVWPLLAAAEDFLESTGQTTASLCPEDHRERIGRH